MRPNADDLTTPRFWVFCALYFPTGYGLLDLIYHTINGHWMQW